MPAECSIDPDDLYGVEDVTWEWLDMPPPPSFEHSDENDSEIQKYIVMILY